MANVYIGTSGFHYQHWINNFYPKDIKKGQLLSYYAKHFKTVEINSSFYHLLKEKTVKDWLNAVADDFIFCFKGSRYITHMKKLSPEKENIDKFFSPLKSLSSKKTKRLVLFQTPSFLKKDPKKLDQFLKILPDNFLYAFEFRNNSWFSEQIYKIARKHNAAIVLSDSPIKKDGRRTWPYHQVETADFFYLRFHGSKRLYASSYTDEELSKYAHLVKGKLKRNLSIFCYFNNDAEGWATENADRLKQLVKE